MERAFRADLGEVRLHTDRESRVLCRMVGARAFTVGTHVFLGDPAADRALLAHEVAHVLQRETGVVRRVIPGLRGAMMKRDAVLARLVTNEPALKAEAEAADIDVGALVDAYVEHDAVYYLADLYQELRRQVESRSFVMDIDLGLPGVRLQYKDDGASGVDQDFTAVSSTDRLDVHPTEIRFWGAVAAQLDQDQVNQWTLGLVQNVLTAHREVQLVKPSHAVRTVTMAVSTPTSDRRADEGPWYDTFQSSHLLDRDYQEARVSLDDAPGFWLGKDADEELHALSGWDEFRTWLALRRADGTMAWLFSWDWRIDYEGQGGRVSLTGTQWYPPDSGAVLDGARASQSVATSSTVTQPPHEEDEGCCPPGCVLS